MKKKKALYYSMITLSSGYLLYVYLFSDIRYGMMHHHYGYYDGQFTSSFYLNSVLVFVSYIVLIFSVVNLILVNQKQKTNATSILDIRLSRGEITVEEYKVLKSIIQKNSD